MSKTTAMTLTFLLLPVAQVTGTAGIAGSQGPRPGAVHLPLTSRKAERKDSHAVGGGSSHYEIPGRFLPMSALVRSARVYYTPVSVWLKQFIHCKHILQLFVFSP